MGMRGSRKGSIFRQFERALLARQVVVTVLPLALYVLPLDTVRGAAILFLAGAATILNFLYYLIHIRGWAPGTLRWSRLVLDVFLWTMLLHLTGGPASVFYAGYIVEILISALAVSAAGCLAAGILSGAAYLLLFAAHPGLLSWEQGAAGAVALLLTGILAFALVRRLEGKSRRVEALNEELTAQATLLRDECRRLSRKLAHAENLGEVGMAASGMAHELLNTLHGVSGFLSILRRDLGEQPRYARFVSLLESGVQGMNDIGEELLSMSREAARTASTVDLRELIDEAIAFATKGRKPPGVEIIVRAADPPHRVVAGRTALRGVFVNLIRNALQAMPAGGELRIDLGRDGGDRLRVDFTDTGTGIEPSAQPLVFDPFFTMRTGGTGLGLGLSRRIVAGCGGRLTLSRSGPEGTTMTVVLPACRAGSSTDVDVALGRGPLPASGRVS